MGEFVLNVNGASVSVDAAPDESLLYVLRDRLQLTGTKYGCGEGQCGACTVLLDGRATRSCLTPVARRRREDRNDRRPGARRKLSAVQQAFLDEGAFQCGYCTSGMIVSATALLREKRNPSDDEIVTGDERKRVPVRNVSAHSRGDQARSAAWRRGSEPMSARNEFEREFFEGGSWTPPGGWQLDRRGFLKLFGGGLFVGLASAKAVAQEAGRSFGEHALPKDLSAWLHIAADGRVKVFTGKVEVGQNIRTSLAQQVAEELRVTFDAIEMVMGDTALVPYDMGTFGSRTTPTMGPELRTMAGRRGRC